MCNEVCYCCERDLCYCKNAPELDLKELVKDIMLNGNNRRIKSMKLGQYTGNTFYIETYLPNGILTDKLKKEHEELHNKLLSAGYDLQKTNNDGNYMYSFFFSTRI